MENDGAIFRTASKLEVFAPKPSSLNQASLHFNDVAETLPANSPVDRVSKEDSSLDQNATTRPSSNASEISIGESVSSLGLQPSSSPAVGNRRKRFSIVRAITSLPSWLVSFVFHLGLILILAILTLAVPQDESIFVEISQSKDTSIEEMSIVLDLDVPDIEDTSDALDADEMEFDLPLVELLDEPIPDTFEVDDQFAMTELPEFASPEAKAAAASADQGDNAEADQGAGAQGESDEAAEFFGTKSYGSDFVFVIDCSSSMGQFNRWYRAVNELLRSLEELDSDQSFLVLLYNDQTYMMLGAPFTQGLVPATGENKNKIRNWLRAAYPFSGTRPASAIRLALKKNPDAIYFLSDGELRDNTMTGLRTWNRAKRGPDSKMRKTPIHTILLGSKVGRATMRTIAEENNGIFTEVR